MAPLIRRLGGAEKDDFQAMPRVALLRGRDLARAGIFFSARELFGWSRQIHQSLHAIAKRSGAAATKFWKRTYPDAALDPLRASHL